MVDKSFCKGLIFQGFGWITIVHQSGTPWHKRVYSLWGDISHGTQNCRFGKWCSMLNAHICSHFPFHFGVMFSFLLLVLRRVQTFQYQKKPLKTSRAKAAKRLKRITSILIESGQIISNSNISPSKICLEIDGFPWHKGFPISLPKDRYLLGGNPNRLRLPDHLGHGSSCHVWPKSMLCHASRKRRSSSPRPPSKIKRSSQMDRMEVDGSLGMKSSHKPGFSVFHGRISHQSFPDSAQLP